MLGSGTQRAPLLRFLQEAGVKCPMDPVSPELMAGAPLRATAAKSPVTDDVDKDQGRWSASVGNNVLMKTLCSSLTSWGKATHFMASGRDVHLSTGTSAISAGMETSSHPKALRETPRAEDRGLITPPHHHQVRGQKPALN